MEILISNKAAQEYEEAYQYLKENAGIKVADDLDSLIDHTFEIIKNNPEIGNNNYINLSQTHKFKMFLIRKFNYAIFYTYTKKEIRIARILHTARDINNILFQ